MNKQELARELSKTYLENWLDLERKEFQRRYGLNETTSYLFSAYKTTLKMLTDAEIFNNSISPLAYSAAIIYVNNCIKEKEYYDIHLYINEFIKAYKHAIKEIKKDLLLKELNNMKNNIAPGYVKTKKNNN